MPQYLLVLTETRDAPEVVDRVLSDAQADEADLAVIYVAIPSEDQTVTQKLADQSFLPPAQRFEATAELKRSQLRHATERLAQIGRKAEARGISIESDLVEGDFGEQALALADMKKADRMYIAGKRSGPVRRLLFGSDLEELIESAECEVVVVEPP